MLSVVRTKTSLFNLEDLSAKEISVKGLIKYVKKYANNYFIWIMSDSLYEAKKIHCLITNFVQTNDWVGLPSYRTPTKLGKKYFFVI